MIAICCKLYARLGCGLRGIGKVFDTISEELPFLLGEAPSHTTIADWIRVYGLALYSQACKEIAGMRYAIIVDESITIGSQKLLLVLGVPAEHLGRPLQHSDVRVLGIEVASSWPACDVEFMKDYKHVESIVKDKGLSWKTQSNARSTSYRPSRSRILKASGV